MSSFCHIVLNFSKLFRMQRKKSRKLDLINLSSIDNFDRVHTKWFSQAGIKLHFDIVNAFFKILKTVSEIRKGNHFSF